MTAPPYLLLPDAVLAAPGTGVLAAGEAVAVEGGRIAAVGPATDPSARFPGAQRIDLAGRDRGFVVYPPAAVDDLALPPPVDRFARAARSPFTPDPPGSSP